MNLHSGEICVTQDSSSNICCAAFEWIFVLIFIAIFVFFRSILIFCIFSFDLTISCVILLDFVILYWLSDWIFLFILQPFCISSIQWIDCEFVISSKNKIKISQYLNGRKENLHKKKKKDLSAGLFMEHNFSVSRKGWVRSASVLNLTAYLPSSLCFLFYNFLTLYSRLFISTIYPIVFR